MISYTFFELPNGLRVIHHEDTDTQLCVLNVLYDVGSKHENPNQTGFAHLFEHLMFGGSVNIPEYDTPLQYAGGENNAFTNNDFTNYYLTLPASNIETGFWLESDRMLGLAFNNQSLETQRNVVIEEYKERYLNPPYGDVWLHVLPLSYTQHPYRWPTIGMDISHIENAQMQDVKNFFNRFYTPSNAILVVAGNISLDRAKELSEKWFGPIPGKPTQKPTYSQEPKQVAPRQKTIHANVPANLLVKTYHTVERQNPDYYTTDIITDILGSGKSSRLFESLVKTQKLFSEVDCYLTGDIDAGLLIIQGKLAEGVSPSVGESAIESLLSEFCSVPIGEEELSKIKNKIETTIHFNNIGILNKAMKLAYCCLLGDIHLVNDEAERYQNISALQIQTVAQQLFDPNNCSTLYYLANQHASS